MWEAHIMDPEEEMLEPEKEHLSVASEACAGQVQAAGVQSGYELYTSGARKVRFGQRFEVQPVSSDIPESWWRRCCAWFLASAWSSRLASLRIKRRIGVFWSKNWWLKAFPSAKMWLRRVQNTPLLAFSPSMATQSALQGGTLSADL